MAKVFDLIERTSIFGENIIRFCNSMPRTVVTTPLIYQLVKAGTSIGANYHEADNAESRRDFRHKIGICRKESKETEFFLRMISVQQILKTNFGSLLFYFFINFEKTKNTTYEINLNLLLITIYNNSSHHLRSDNGR